MQGLTPVFSGDEQRDLYPQQIPIYHQEYATQ